MTRHLDLHIDALLVDGIAVADHASLGAAVQAELARLFTERGVPPSLGAGGAVSLDGGRFTATPGAAPGTLGAQIAGAVYGGLAR